MGCCGKPVRQIGAIAAGYMKALIGKQDDYSAGRIEICTKCEDNTWLTLKEYSQWLVENGIKVLRYFTQLEKLPMLEKKERTKGTKLFCRKCKCYLKAKTKREKEHCPIDKW